MTLLVTVFAAIFSTIIWYKNLPDNKMRIGTLSLMYWGAAIMWIVDKVFEYVESPSDFFTPSPIQMLNDLYLGLIVVALGLIIWIIILLIKDPKNALKSVLLKKNI